MIYLFEKQKKGDSASICLLACSPSVCSGLSRAEARNQEPGEEVNPDVTDERQGPIAAASQGPHEQEVGIQS